jgi:hypothetical protein
MATLAKYPRTLDPVRTDVAGHSRMRAMFATIEQKIAALAPVYQELYRRNLTYEYFQAQGGVPRLWKSP